MERFIIVGEKAQCKTCFVFFTPGSGYHKRCEQRTDFPPQSKHDPHAFCSEACEQKAIGEVRQGRIEFQRIMEAA
jgi:hypothetical protein